MKKREGQAEAKGIDQIPFLSTRLQMCAECMANGLSNKEIGEAMGNTVGTIKGMARLVLSKIGMSRYELIREWTARGAGKESGKEVAGSENATL